MKKLLTVVLAVALTVTFASSDQDSLTDEEMSKFLGLSLEGIETLGVEIEIFNHDDIRLSEAEVRDRVHLAFMRGKVEFTEITEDNRQSYYTDDSKVIVRFTLEVQEVFDSTQYHVSARVLVHQSVRLERDLSIRALVPTFIDSSSSFAISSLVTSSSYQRISHVAEEFVRSYKLNNPSQTFQP